MLRHPGTHIPATAEALAPSVKLLGKNVVAAGQGRYDRGTRGDLVQNAQLLFIRLKRTDVPRPSKSQPAPQLLIRP